MAYRLHYSDYSTTEGPPDPAEWVGPPGPMGPVGPMGPQGPMGGLSGGTLTGPLIYTATGGTVSRSAQDRAADVANVLDFGADPTGLADSAPAINAAIGPGQREVFLPAGTYRINGQINVAPGTVLRGASLKTTFLTVDQAFSPTATGVLSLSGFEFQSPDIRDLSITFAQPSDTTTTATAASAVGATTVTVASVANIAVNNYIAGPNAALPILAMVTAIAGNVLTLSTPLLAPGVANGDVLRFGPSRANMLTLAAGGTSGRGGTGIKYPPAIYGPAAQTNRFHLSNLYVGGAWDGISALGNVCPHIENIEMGALNIGWNADGALDSVHVHSWRSWLYGFSQTSQIGVFNVHHDGQTIGWNLGRIDGLNASNITLVDANFVTTANADQPAAGLSIPWLITGLQLDGVPAYLQIAGGNLHITDFYRSAASGYNTTNAITVTGGTTIISNFHLFQSGTLATINQTGGRLQFTGGIVIMANGITSVLTQSGGTFVFMNSYVTPPSAVTVPMFAQTAGSFVMEGNAFHAGTSGVAVSIGSDNATNFIANNDFSNYTLSLPAEPLLGLYSAGWDNVYGQQLTLGTIGQGGRIDFRRGTDSRKEAWIGTDGATSADVRLQNLSGGSRIIFDTAASFSFQVGGVQYATSANTYGNHLKLGYTGTGGRVDFARGSDGGYFCYVGMLSAASNAVGIVSTLGSPVVVVGAQSASGTVSLQTNGVERLGVTDTAINCAQPLVIGASGPTIRSGTGAASGTQPKGSIWLRTDGAAGSTMYVSQGAGTWNAVASV